MCIIAGCMLLRYVCVSRMHVSMLLQYVYDSRMHVSMLLVCV